jgi:hypothetical protein
VSSDEGGDEEFFEFDFKTNAAVSPSESPRFKADAASPAPPVVEVEERQFSDCVDDGSSGDDEDFFEFQFGGEPTASADRTITL